MDAEERGALAARILERSTADATEVIVNANRRALTRFTHEFIHQNVDIDEVSVRIRAIAGGKTGVAETNRTDDAAIAAALERALQIASFAPADPALPALAGAADAVAPPRAYVAATAGAGADLRANVASRIFAQAQAHDCWSSGYVTTSTSGVTIATTAGARASFDGTDAGVNVKMTAGDSTGFAERYGSDANVLDGDAVGARAAEKARASAHPVGVEPGEWTVILEPPAFGELLQFLASHFSAQSCDEGSSFLTGRLGECVMGENVTIRDDYAHPLHPDMPFDWEASPKQRLPIIEHGVARNVVTDRRWAEKAGQPSTGHGLPAPNSHGPYPLNLVVDAGTTPLEELIATTKRGLLVTRLWYTRIVDQRRTILTGMTRDGTFLIKNGIVGGGVHNLRFNQSLVDALATCVLGDTQARTGGYSYAAVVPAVKFERFAFASTTDY
jgi:predicted Zn-dependent protease